MKKFKIKETLPYLGVGVSAAGVGISAARKVAEEKQHKEQTNAIKKLEDKIDKLEKKVNEKKFSILGGNNKKSDPMSVLERAVKFTACTSVFNLGEERHAISDDLINAFKSEGGLENVHYCLSSASSNYNYPVIYYKGQVLVINISEYNENFKKLDKILTSYCNTFNQASYSSERVSGDYMIELYVVENTEKILANLFIKSSIVVKILK